MEKKQPKTKYCSNCGYELNEEDEECPVCGAKNYKEKKDDRRN